MVAYWLLSERVNEFIHGSQVHFFVNRFILFHLLHLSDSLFHWSMSHEPFFILFELLISFVHGPFHLLKKHYFSDLVDKFYWSSGVLFDRFIGPFTGSVVHTLVHHLMVD